MRNLERFVRKPLQQIHYSESRLGGHGGCLVVGWNTLKPCEGAPNVRMLGPKENPGGSLIPQWVSNMANVQTAGTVQVK